MADFEQTDDTKREVLELQVVPSWVGTGVPGPGRPLFLTPRRFLTIIKMIEGGARVTQACRQALVSYAGFRNHVARNPKYQKRLHKAEKIRDEVWKDHALEMIRQAMPKNWIACMTYLERKYPNEYSLRTVNRVEPATLHDADAITKEVLLTVPKDEFDEFKAMSDTRMISNTELEHIEHGTRMTVYLLEQHGT